MVVISKMEVSEYVVQKYLKGYSIEYIYKNLYRMFSKSDRPITLQRAHYLVEKCVTDYLIQSIS